VVAVATERSEVARHRQADLPSVPRLRYTATSMQNFRNVDALCGVMMKAFE
jgi:hypothetical protein